MVRLVKVDCLRCESVGRTPPNLGHIPMIGPNGVDTVVCQDCLDELKEEGNLYYALDFEDQENKKVS
jgi:hypothetical protein